MVTSCYLCCTSTSMKHWRRKKLQPPHSCKEPSISGQQTQHRHITQRGKLRVLLDRPRSGAGRRRAADERRADAARRAAAAQLVNVR